MIRAKNEQDLLSILRVISSEAVDLSKKMNESADPSLGNFVRQRKADEGIYGDLVAEEDEVDPEEESPEEPSEEQPPEEPEEPSEESSDATGEVGASFDSVVKAVNNLRAGKSLRDSSIKQQAQDYYDKLSEEERTTLLVFLKAMSDIIAGQVDGKDAQDPGEPPVSINISSNKETPEEQPTAEPAEEAPAEPAEDIPPEESEEDTSPPIKVNESQDLALIRKKVRRMMLRG